MPKMVQIAVRIPEEWVARLEAIAKRMSYAGTAAKTSAAIREALLSGIEALEEDVDDRPKGKKAAAGKRQARR